MIVTWALLSAEGKVETGRGSEPPKGWFNRVRASVGLALLFAGGIPPVYAVRPTCSNDVDRPINGAPGSAIRYWGVTPEPGSQVWFFPQGDMVGIGRDTSEVERLVLAFQGKLKASEVARDPDQRSRAGEVSGR